MLALSLLTLLDAFADKHAKDPMFDSFAYLTYSISLAGFCRRHMRYWCVGLQPKLITALELYGRTLIQVIASIINI